MNIRLVLGVGLWSLSLPIMANQTITPYFGADVKQSQIEFNQNLGDKLIQKNYPQGNLFAGVKFNEWLGAEFGYESTARKTRTAIVPDGEKFFGSINLGDPLSATTKTKIAGPHVNVLGFYPIFEEYCISLFGSFGLANLKFKSQLDYVEVVPPQQVETRFFSKTKLLPRATLGIQHMINNNLGVRAMATWEKTSAFKNIYAKNSVLYVRPKDSRSFGVGVFYSF